MIKAATSPQKVTAVKAKRVKSKVKLTWKKVKGADGYEIYRATSKKGKYQKIKTLKKGTIVSYTDGKAKKGKTYYYKVRAVKMPENIGERNCFKCSALWKIKRFIIIMIIWSVDKADSKNPCGSKLILHGFFTYS